MLPLPPVRLAFLLLAASSLGFAPLPFPRPPKKTPGTAAAESLLGNWHNPANPSVVVNITSREFAYVNSGSRNNVYVLTIDLGSPLFKYDIRRGGANYVGIWKIEGDKLTLLYNVERVGQPDGGRPLSFDAPGNREIYFRMGARK